LDRLLPDEADRTKVLRAVHRFRRGAHQTSKHYLILAFPGNNFAGLFITGHCSKALQKKNLFFLEISLLF